eukprot:gene3857-2735_t
MSVSFVYRKKRNTEQKLFLIEVFLSCDGVTTVIQEKPVSSLRCIPQASAVPLLNRYYCSVYL